MGYYTDNTMFWHASALIMLFLLSAIAIADMNQETEDPVNGSDVKVHFDPTMCSVNSDRNYTCEITEEGNIEIPEENMTFKVQAGR